MDIAEIKASIDNYHGEAKNGLAVLDKDLTSLSRDVSELMKKVNRTGSGGGSDGLSPDEREHKSAFNTWARSGRGEDDLADLQRKAMNTGADPDGGYAVPQEIDRELERLLRDISPIRRIARVVNVGSGDYKKLVRTTGAASGWVGEQESRPETTAPKFAAVAPPLGQIYANPAVSQDLLDDALFNLSMWLEEELAAEFVEREGAAFVNGTGVKQPRGFLTYDLSTDIDSARSFGTLQYLTTGVSGDWPASDPEDKLIDLVHSLRPGYRQGASWVMNSSTLASVRKMKDSNGAFIWQAGLQDGQPSRLLGYPVTEAEDMPDIAASSLSVAFGNFQRGYTIVDRMGVRLLRDPYTNKPNVLFYATKRVGGGLVNSEAIKLLKFGTS